MKKISKFLFFILLLTSLVQISVNAEIIKKIIIDGNQRISDETVKMFSLISVNDKLNENDLNKLLKNLYETNFFENITINFENGILSLFVVEYPVIDNISAWWSFPAATPDKNAAQWWHFDLDRPKWLKFFFFSNRL